MARVQQDLSLTKGDRLVVDAKKKKKKKLLVDTEEEEEEEVEGNREANEDLCG